MFIVSVRLLLGCVRSFQQAPEEALGKREACQNAIFFRDSLTRELYMLIFLFPYLVKCLAYLATFLSHRPATPYILCSPTLCLLVRSSNSYAVNWTTGIFTEV
jgi:hypothetical protein